jgi:WD40 repeat protein
MGTSSISVFPKSFSTPNTQLVLAYGGNSVKKGDTYGMLLSIRSASSPPILHWKCRLPEADLTGGLIVSPCGYYVVGGGASGTCFLWSSLGGNLLKAFKAHYRACTCMAWSDCGKYLVTGGADGMVHLFPLMELVDQGSRNTKRTIAPLHTWSFHHFPVTCLTTLNSGRMASGAEDGQVVIMELFSKEIVATIKLPHGVGCLTHYDSRLYVGSDEGTIYSINLNAYAMHQAEKQGATLTKRQRKEQQTYLTAAEKVFGKPDADDSASNRLYQTDWIGHEHPVSSIAFLVEDMKERLISGDKAGEIRIWDVESKTCLNVVQPWSNTVNTTAKRDTPVARQAHPITSLLVVPQPSDSASSGMFAAPASGKGQSSIATLVTPLQKYNQEATGASPATPVPFLKSNRTVENLEFWEARTLARKRKREAGTSSTSAPTDSQSSDELQEARDLVSKLQRELETKRGEVARWEKVNNKLMTKLKSKA